MEMGLRIFLLFIGAVLLIAIIWDVFRKKSANKSNQFNHKNTFYGNSLQRVKILNEKGKNFISSLSKKFEINKKLNSHKPNLEPIISLKDDKGKPVFVDDVLIGDDYDIGSINYQSEMNFENEICSDILLEERISMLKDKEYGLDDEDDFSIEEYLQQSSEFNTKKVNNDFSKEIKLKTNEDNFDTFIVEQKTKSFKEFGETFLSAECENEVNKKLESNIHTREKITEKENNAYNQMLSVSVVAKKGSNFSGQKLLQVFELLNLYYGKMKIFHKYTDNNDKNSESLFSIVSAREPGIFDLFNMHNEKYYGITLFFIPSMVSNLELSLEQMLKTAKQLVFRLNGELLDRFHKPLTLDELDEYKISLKQVVNG